jgi:uncharacterized membrane protein
MRRANRNVARQVLRAGKTIVRGIASAKNEFRRELRAAFFFLTSFVPAFIDEGSERNATAIPARWLAGRKFHSRSCAEPIRALRSKTPWQE